MDNLIGNVIEWFREDEDGDKVENVKVNPGGDIPVTSMHSMSPGEDSPPYKKDLAILVKVPGAQNFVTVGYIDPVNEGVAADGEVRRYGLAVPHSSEWRSQVGKISDYMKKTLNLTIYLVSASGVEEK